MDEKHNISPFTAADIEKYHRGLLSPAERHALEKAALDDPFLADALEGYAVEGVNLEKDMEDLRARLAERTGRGKVIPMGGRTGQSFRWWKAAAVILFLAGGATLVFRFSDQDGKKEVAQLPATVADTATAAGAEAGTEVTFGETEPPTARSISGKNIKSAPPPAEPGKEIPASSAPAYPAAPADNLLQNPPTADIVFTEKKASEERAGVAETVQPAAPKPPREMTKAEPVATTAPAARKEANDVARAISEEQALASRKAMALRYEVRGRVTDQNNAGVPFARVANPRNRLEGTYTDAEGNFTLPYTDSVLTVEVNALGYRNNQVQVSGNAPLNQITLQQENNSLQEVVVTGYNRTAPDKKKAITGPEPIDGWELYDQYLINNKRLPAGFDRQKNGGTVILSLAADRKGRPVQVKVEKSLHPDLDREALRLVLEGPRWKRNAAGGRSQVNVIF